MKAFTAVLLGAAVQAANLESLGHGPLLRGGLSRRAGLGLGRRGLHAHTVGVPVTRIDQVADTVLTKVPRTVVDQVATTVVKDVPRTVIDEIPVTVTKDVPRTVVRQVEDVIVKDVPRTVIDEVPRTIVTEVPRTVIDQVEKKIYVEQINTVIDKVVSTIVKTSQKLLLTKLKKLESRKKSLSNPMTLEMVMHLMPLILLTTHPRDST